ncbi:MAG: hypothetical protein ACOX6K_02190 [Sphaerochaetaceae bacterium]|jgi:hypothetical protein
MKRAAVLTTILLVLVPALLGARSLFGLRFGFTGMYVEPSGSDGSDGVFSGFGDGENWDFGGELSMRVSVLRLSASVFSTQLGAEAESESSDTSISGVRVLGTFGVSLPIINDYLDLEVGAGMGVRMMLPDSGDVYCAFPDGNGGYVTTPVSELEVVDILRKSPFHVRVGLDLTIGPFGVGAFYLMETKATIEGFDATGGWARLFQQETGSFGVGISLSLF